MSEDFFVSLCKFPAENLVFFWAEKKENERQPAQKGKSQQSHEDSEKPSDEIEGEKEENEPYCACYCWD